MRVLMPTPLFPEDTPDFTTTQDKSDLSAIQGNVGSCYLLACIDCIAKGNRRLLEKLFIQEEDGVWVTLQRVRTHTPNLNRKNIQNKYTHRYNAQTGEDLFFISNERLEEIDNTPSASQSNSLAVKILEHLTSYYFTKPWSNIELKPHERSSLRPSRIKRSASVEAHDLTERFDERESDLVGRMLNVNVVSTTNIEFIRLMKTHLYRDEPVYVKMHYDDPRDSDNKHKLHALRVHTIEVHPDITEQYVFWFFNPWNNQVAERHVCRKDKVIEFSMFETNPQRFRVLNLLLKAPMLLNQVINLKIADPTFEPEHILIDNDEYIDHHVNYLINTLKTRLVHKFVRRIQQFTISFDEMYTTEAVNIRCEQLIDTLINSLENNKQLSALHSLLRHYPLAIKEACVEKKQDIRKAARQRLQENQFIQTCLFKLDNLPITFFRETTIAGVQIREHALQDQVITLANSYRPCSMIKERTEKKLELIRQQSKSLQDKIEEVNNYLQHIGFTDQFSFLIGLIDSNRLVAFKDDQNHRIKTYYGKVLQASLEEAKRGFITSLLPWKDRLLIFKNNALLALNQAPQHFSPYPEWMGVIKLLKKILETKEKPTSTQSFRSHRSSFFSRQQTMKTTTTHKRTSTSFPTNPQTLNSSC